MGQKTLVIKKLRLMENEKQIFIDISSYFKELEDTSIFQDRKLAEVSAPKKQTNNQDECIFFIGKTSELKEIRAEVEQGESKIVKDPGDAVLIEFCAGIYQIEDVIFFFSTSQNRFTGTPIRKGIKKILEKNGRDLREEFPVSKEKMNDILKGAKEMTLTTKKKGNFRTVEDVKVEEKMTFTKKELLLILSQTNNPIDDEDFTYEVDGKEEKATKVSFKVSLGKKEQTLSFYDPKQAYFLLDENCFNAQGKIIANKVLECLKERIEEWEMIKD